MKYKRELCENVEPATRHNYVGIEFELCSPLDYSDMDKLIEDSEFREFVAVSTDGSICPDMDDYDYELKMCVKQCDVATIVPRFTKFLKREAKAYVNETCGLHVHLDVRNRNAEEVYKRLYKHQDVLFALVTPERRENEYCMRSEKEDMLEQMNYFERCAINPKAIERHKTIEVRLHQGSLEGKDIVNWIELLTLIVKRSVKTESNVVRLGEFMAKRKLTTKLKGYIRRKVLKYA